MCVCIMKESEKRGGRKSEYLDEFLFTNEYERGRKEGRKSFAKKK